MEKQLLEEIYIPNMNKLIEAIKSKANEYYNIPMLSHTHGQSATPTTVGKEWIIYVYRLNKILDKIKKLPCTCVGVFLFIFAGIY